MDNPSPIEILLVEDNPGDRELAREALAQSKIKNNLTIVVDGEEALAYLQQGPANKNIRPDLILLDLNLPKIDGREVLAEIKKDSSLKTIPVVILTTSQNEIDILESYNLQANCYITKPIDFKQFLKVIQSIENFWLTIVKLPPKGAC